MLRSCIGNSNVQRYYQWKCTFIKSECTQKNWHTFDGVLLNIINYIDNVIALTKQKKIWYQDLTVYQMCIFFILKCIF